MDDSRVALEALASITRSAAIVADCHALIAKALAVQTTAITDIAGAITRLIDLAEKQERPE